jgi:alpha-L-fucosidase 2
MGENYNYASALWYQTPSREGHIGWEEDALPLGNGDLGCKIFGDVERERIQLNEKSLWSGTVCGMGGNTNGNGNGDRGESLRLIQKLLKEKKYQEARQKMTLLQGDEIGLGAYQNLGDMYLDFDSYAGNSAAEPAALFDCNSKIITEYQRGLDMSKALAWTSYKKSGCMYKREAFVSYPARTAVYRLQGDMKHLRISLKLAQEKEQESWSKDGCLILGRVREGVLRYALCLGVVTDGRCVTNQKEQENALVIENAHETILYLTIVTDYGWEYPEYRRDEKEHIEQIVQERIGQAMKKGWQQLYEEHLRDYQSLFQRASVEIGQEPLMVPTDELLHMYQQGEESRLLESLLFQYGRYLLIASSRTGGLPANLQGVWNDSNEPIWQSDYHLNINLQMNYWLALNTNLSETMEPLFHYINQCLVIPGRQTAYAYTGIGDETCKEAKGWMAHTQNNIFGHTGAGSVWKWGWAPANGAFLLWNTFEYYRFTKDIEVLEKDIFPAIEEHVRLWSQLLEEDEENGRLLASPCFSPEHGPVTRGGTFDQTMVWQLYRDYLDGAEDLCIAGREETVDKELVELIKKQIARIVPCEMGRWGQIKEWMQEDEWENRGFDDMGVQYHHRHFSHLMGLYPGRYISERMPVLADAARKSLIDRGDAGPSWSMALRVGLWARLGDGERCHQYLRELIIHNTYPNLWGYHPPFQIDGNFGVSAGMAEMLLQSYENRIILLPALPKAWEKKGSFRGLAAVGKYYVDACWSEGELEKVCIKAGEESGRYEEIRKAESEVEVCWRTRSWKLRLKAGETYQIDLCYKS